MHIALYKPDIPQNTAAIIRLGACLNLKIHIIEPCGFNLHDSRFKRVVMDYMGMSRIFRYKDYDDFLKKNKNKRIVLMTTKAKKHYHKFKFKKNDMMLFGRESAGVPENLHKTIKNNGGLRVSIDFGITTKKSKGIVKKNPIDKNVVHKDIQEVLQIGHTKQLKATETLKECYERIKNDNYKSVPNAHVSDNIKWS